MLQLHRRRVISYRLHGPQNPKSYEPGHTRGSQAYELSIRYFMPRSHYVLGQSAGHVKAKAV